ncbi:serine-rich adhesin for platelets [Aedes albopictus]|uniref:PH domain-containing protein n=1 Tax=Aedes albopictus TaxID=7160 RepID=A0ABM2A4G6_AEDAL|nr:uncharacterized protein LOC109397232 [Aedes albopictus]
MMEPRGALFREIHKNTWLRRLSGDGKRPSVLAKKADRYWVVFCVHDDCEAFLEGYVDPRQAPSHSPEWSLSLQTVQHISHALVPVEQEFEFVITLSSDVARFNANTWECMQEWVDSLRSKLREMKLLSPKENLYSKLPEVRPPLAPTRDPTSPLPATPPVPAAIVPGIERVQPTSLHHHTPGSSQPSSIPPVAIPSTSTASPSSSSTSHVPPITAMSNTSTQNLMNLLTNPLQAVSSINNQYISSQHLFDAISLASSDLSDGSLDEYSSDLIKRFISSNGGALAASSQPPSAAPPVASGSSGSPVAGPSTSSGGGGSSNLGKPQQQQQQQQQKPVKENGTGGGGGASSSLATTFANNVLGDPGTTSLKRTDKKVLVDVKADDFAAADSGSDEEADASNSSSGTGTTSSTSSSRSSSSSSSKGSSSSGSRSSGDRARRIGNESGNESSLLSTSPAAATQFVQSSAAEPSSAMSSSPFSKARHTNRDDPKRTRRKSGHKSSSKSSANVTIIQVSTGSSDSESPVKLLASPKAKHRTPKQELVTKLSNGSTLITDDLSDDNYKSNVQIIPSNVEYDHHHHHHVSLLPDHHLQEPSIIASINDRQITTVKVPNLVVNGSGSSGSNGTSSNSSGNVTISSTSVSTAQPTVIVAASSTPIKSDSNFGTVTQISVNASCDRPRTPPQQQHYEQVFLLPSPVQVVNNLEQPISLQSPPSSSSAVAAKLNKSKITLLSKQPRSSSHSEIQLNRVKQLRIGQGNKENEGGVAGSSGHKSGILPSASSPAVPSSGGNLSPSKRTPADKNIYTPQPQRPMLQRGLTEMVISRSTNAVVAGGRDPARGRMPTAQQTADKFRNEVNEQRRRSSSTSDAQPETSGNPAMRARLNGASRLQSPPQPFRPHHQLINQQLDSMNGSNRKMTLREQQVMQLRREMMHPGGVRLQLRRKDCINSIGLVDAFGAVWVAGWKQKEHPVLYNALHIGDQLISVAGMAITSSAEAHKVIRGAPGLFVELIIRRVPFGRVYAIRRELDGQCLGLIRDGNTSTIVDVVPNSLAARHGLPPKAQSCDGLSLTFWVLTEINGRPLNLFFKDNEIRDRLNAVGRDISILVQPADLVTKLKKQLKSLRGHKDFIVQ